MRILNISIIRKQLYTIYQVTVEQTKLTCLDMVAQLTPLLSELSSRCVPLWRAVGGPKICSVFCSLLLLLTSSTSTHPNQPLGGSSVGFSSTATSCFCSRRVCWVFSTILCSALRWFGTIQTLIYSQVLWAPELKLNSFTPKKNCFCSVTLSEDLISWRVWMSSVTLLHWTRQ